MLDPASPRQSASHKSSLRLGGPRGLWLRGCRHNAFRRSTRSQATPASERAERAGPSTGRRGSAAPASTKALWGARGAEGSPRICACVPMLAHPLARDGSWSSPCPCPCSSSSSRGNRVGVRVDRRPASLSIDGPGRQGGSASRIGDRGAPTPLRSRRSERARGPGLGAASEASPRAHRNRATRSLPVRLEASAIPR